MVNFLCTPSCSRIALTVTMETMHFFIVQLSLSLRTKLLCISGVPMNDLAPMKNCPGGGCKLGQISSRGITSAQARSMLFGFDNMPSSALNQCLFARFTILRMSVRLPKAPKSAIFVPIISEVNYL